MIYHLLYISEKSELFNEERDLNTIIEKSVKNNKAKDLTGMLIKNGNFFIQLLEGKKEVVVSTYNMIASDKRHTRVKTLMTYQDSHRMFPNWYMGLIQSQEFELTIQELIPLLHANIMKIDEPKEKIISVLKKFNNVASEPKSS